MSVAPFGDSAVLISLEQRVDERIVAHARVIADAWEAEGLGYAVPAYASVLGRFDPLVLAPTEALVRARSLLARAGPLSRVPEGRLIEVPTTYDGPDLDEVARLSGLTRRETVSAHSSRVYSVFFLGFMPGFAYCGRLDERLVAPRLEVPRPRVPAGSVAVADGQTAVYPFEAPGGWRLIGRTRLRPYDARRDPPVLLTAGDRVRFVEVAG